MRTFWTVEDTLRIAEKIGLRHGGKLTDEQLEAASVFVQNLLDDYEPTEEWAEKALEFTCIASLVSEMREANIVLCEKSESQLHRIAEQHLVMLEQIVQMIPEPTRTVVSESVRTTRQGFDELTRSHEETQRRLEEHRRNRPRPQ